MNKSDIKKVQRILLLVGLITVVICFVVMLFFRSHLVSSGFQKAIVLLTPFIYGAVIAYLLCPVCAFCEKWLTRLFDRNGEGKHKGLISIISILLSLVLLFLILLLLLVAVIPELVSSITKIVQSFPRALNSFERWLKNLGEGELVPAEVVAWVESSLNGGYDHLEEFLKTDLLPRLNTLMGGMGTSIKSIFGVLSNFALGVIISAYILGERRNFKRQLILILRAAFSERTANWILKEASFANQKFNGFLIGKIVDSTIIGVLCFIFLALTGMPYTILISIIVGVTNMIPFFGPYIGMIPSAILILTVSPVKCIIFLVFIILLQQLDGNVIGPKILGDKLGLSSFWILFSILIFGSLWGLVGMIVGAPLFAVIYDLCRSLVHLGLKKRGIRIDAENDPSSADGKTDTAEELPSGEGGV